MKRRPAVAASVLAFSLTACAAQESGSDPADTWVGTITSEGNVTTVVNESGSVWGGNARLVEDLSIGVETGDEAYMFGRITGIYATDDEIFVVDEQVPVVRVFDMEGRHVRDLGAAGQGPGEFERPRFVTGAPDGRIFVIDGRGRRINIYGPGPDDIDTWELGMGQCCLHAPALAPDGKLWIEGGIVNEQERRYDDAMRAHGPDGPAEEQFAVPAYEYERWTLRYNGRDIETVPYAPQVQWVIHSDGKMIAGVSDQYRFEILDPDGARTVVDKRWDPVEVTEQERTYAQRVTREQYSRNEAGGDASLVWDDRIPATKPAFERFLPSHSGETWVVREGPSTPIEGCDPDERYEIPQLRTTRLRPCFQRSLIIDAFGADGRYLGEIEGPSPHPTYSFIRANTVLAPGQDAQGTVVVRRYRLVLPGEQGR